jgi:hypothetical protein
MIDLLLQHQQYLRYLLNLKNLKFQMKHYCLKHLLLQQYQQFL